MKRAVVLAALLLSLACSGSDRRPQAPPTTHASWWVDTGQGFVVGAAWHCPAEATPAVVAEIFAEVEQAGERVIAAGRSTTCLQDYRILVRPGIATGGTAGHAPQGYVEVDCGSLGAIEHELAEHACAFRLGCRNWKVIGHDGLTLEHCR